MLSNEPASSLKIFFADVVLNPVEGLQRRGENKSSSLECSLEVQERQ